MRIKDTLFVLSKKNGDLRMGLEPPFLFLSVIFPIQGFPILSMRTTRSRADRIRSEAKA